MGFDVDVFRAINTGWANPALDPFFVTISFLGSFALVLFILPLWFTGRKARSIDYLAALAIAVALSTLLKYAIGRLRPDEVLADVRLVAVPLAEETDPSFPSAHVARVAAIATLLSLHERKFALPLVVFVVLEALSRIYVGAHWPTDTIGGAALGISVGVLLWRLDRVGAYTRIRTAILRALGVRETRGERSEHPR